MGKVCTGETMWQVAGAPCPLEGPVSVVPGERVTHLRHRVVR